jgi:hypothetical protein
MLAAHLARKWRWLLPGAAALALHLMLILGIERGIGLPGFADAGNPLPQPPAIVSLLPAKAISKVENTVAVTKPVAPPRKTARSSLPVEPAESMAVPAEIISPPMPVPAALPDTVMAPITEPVAEQTMDPMSEPSAIRPDTIAYRFSAPPPVTIKYDVQKTEAGGQNMYGHGTISWQVDGERYAIEGDAGILFISALNFSSTGMIDSRGVAPERYREKRFRKPEINTHFNRERNRISFSASEKNYPREGGEQDRASIIWQLAGIGRGDSEKIKAGAEIPVFVAGVRDGEIWTMRVIAEEEIDTGAGKLHSWHFLRTPRPGTYEQTIDLWLAPQLDWYPVKLRQTDANGTWLDMTMSSMQRASKP